MSVTAQMVKELREKTGAGMMDSKKALQETGGDMESAVDWLRTKGLAKAAKKAGRTAADGLIGVATDGRRAAMVEVNAETDFVARNEQFQALVRDIASTALGTDGSVGALKAASVNGRTVEETVKEAVATIGEHMEVRRAAMIDVEQGVVSSYVHNSIAPNLGKIGVLVALRSGGDPAQLETLGRQLAMHIAATRPSAIDIASLDPAEVDRERAILADQARESGKPENIIGKMVEGRLQKFYEEVVLLKQTFVIDGERTVEAALADAGKDIGAPIELANFACFVLGEDVAREETDFAAEVAAAVSGA